MNTFRVMSAATSATLHYRMLFSAADAAIFAIFGRRDVHVPAKDPIEMALIGKAAQKCDLLQRQAIFTQVLARTFHLPFQD